MTSPFYLRVVCAGFLLFQAVADEFLHQEVEYREERNAEDQAGETEEAAAQDRRKHDPEAGKTDGFADDTRSDDVAVEELDDQDDTQKIQRLDRVGDQEDKETRDRADPRSEDRDDIGNTDHKCDQDRIIHLQEVHQEEADQTDDRRRDHLAGNEAAELGVSKMDDLVQAVEVFFRKDRFGKALDLVDQDLTVDQYIDCHDNTDDKVHDGTHACDRGSDDIRDLFTGKGNDRIDRIAEQFV